MITIRVKILVLSFLLLAGQVFADTHYISTSGSNTGDCTGSPCKTFSYVQGQASAGDTIQLAAGTYNSDEGGLTTTKSGSAGNYITIQCETDTMTAASPCIVDGEYNRLTFYASGYSYINVVGIHFKRSSLDVIDVTDGSHHINFYRVTAQDAKYVADSGWNEHVWNIHAASHDILLEDCAGWNWGRNILLVYSGAYNVTVRRFWGIYHDKGISSHGPVMSQIYDTHDVLYENVIATTDGTYTGNYLAGISIWDNDTSGEVYNVQVLGSIVYDLGMTDYRYCNFNTSSKGSGAGDAEQMYGIEHTDIVAIGSICGINFMDADNEDVDHATIVGAYEDGVLFDKSDAQYWYTDTTLKNSIILNSANCGVLYVDTPESFVHDYNAWYGNSTNFCDSSKNTHEQDLINPDFDTATYGYGAYLMRPTALNGYGESGADLGAEVLYRYVDGVLTDTPLWPWPMEGRILAETTGNIGKTSVTYSQDQGNGETGGLWKTLTGLYEEPPATATGVTGGGSL